MQRAKPPAARLSGPPALPLVGHLPDLARDPLGFLERLHREHGDLARFSYAGVRAVLASHPGDVERVLLETGKRFHKGYGRGFATPLVLGNGLVTSEGEFWRRQRKLLQPAFHSARIGGYAKTMVALALEMLEGWRDGEVRDVHEEMTLLTQRIVTKTLLGADTSGEGRELGRALDTIMRELAADVLGFEQFLPKGVPTPARMRLRAATRRVDRELSRVVAERRADPNGHDDLLAMLLAAQDDEGAGMTDAQLRDEVMTLYIAGHETTSNALAWTWLLLSQHPEARERLEAELDAALGERPPTFEDLRSLSFADAVVKEAMRLYPPVWSVSRVASETVELGGREVPKGTEVWLCQWITHRDSRWFAEPLAYKPERWLDGLEKRLPRYAYFPFGGGPRVCIGNSFAGMEAVLVLATVARRFRLRVTEATPVELDPGITLRPKRGLPARLEARLGRPT